MKRLITIVAAVFTAVTLLAEYRSGTLMLPASNMKLITTGMAMLALDHSS